MFPDAIVEEPFDEVYSFPYEDIHFFPAALGNKSNNNNNRHHQTFGARVREFSIQPCDLELCIYPLPFVTFNFQGVWELARAVSAPLALVSV